MYIRTLRMYTMQKVCIVPNYRKPTHGRTFEERHWFIVSMY